MSFRSGASQFALFCLALLLVAHAAAAVGSLERPLDHDEGEFLHAAWLIGEGAVLYRDFMEDHPPFTFQLLRLLQPGAGGGYAVLDVERWTARARIATAAIGAIALLSLAGVAYVVAQHPVAPVVAVAFALQNPRFWYRGLADIRADAPALACFWSGALLIIVAFQRPPDRRTALLSGSGIALLVAAALINPKWPLQSLVLGVVFLIILWRLWTARRSDALVALVPTIIVGALAMAAIAAVTTARDYLHFTFELKMAIREHVVAADLYRISDTRTAWGVISPRAVIIVLIAAVLGFLRKRSALVILTLVAVAAIVEAPLYFPYSAMWPQYSLGVVGTVAALSGVLAGAILNAFKILLSGRRAMLAIVAIAIAVLVQWQLVFAAAQREGWLLPIGVLTVMAWLPAIAAIAHAIGRYNVSDAEERLPSWSIAVAAAALGCIYLPYSFGRDLDVDKQWRESWNVRRTLQANLKKDEPIWVGPNLHPIAARDASYHWYAFGDVMAGAMHHGQTAPNPVVPVLFERDLPPCRIASGADARTRYVELGSWMTHYPELKRCVVALIDGGKLQTTPYRGLYEVVRPSVARTVWDDPLISDRLGLGQLRRRASANVQPGA